MKNKTLINKIFLALGFLCFPMIIVFCFVFGPLWIAAIPFAMIGLPYWICEGILEIKEKNKKCDYID